MDTIIIRGGKPLTGNVEVGGSKNDAVAIMAGALLVPGKTILHNVPRISDVYTLMEIFRRLGATCAFREDGALEIDATNLTTSVTPHDLVARCAPRFNVLGALLARFGQASRRHARRLRHRRAARQFPCQGAGAAGRATAPGTRHLLRHGQAASRARTSIWNFPARAARSI